MEWKRSSFCDSSACVEMTWKRSSLCSDNGCVEMSPGSRTVWVRNSTSPEKVLLVDHHDWAVFLAGLQNGQLVR